MDCVSFFLRYLCDGLKWAIEHIGLAIKHIGYATNVENEIRILEEEMRKLEEIYADVNVKVLARQRFQLVKNQVVGWRTRVVEFKERVDGELQLPLNCSCTVHCPNCWTRYQLGKRVVLEHKEYVAKLINEGKEHSNGTVVDPNLPFPIETNIKNIKEEVKKLWDLEADINSKIEATKRERLLFPKHQIERWIKRVSEHKKYVRAIRKDFKEMEKSDQRQQEQWVELSQRAENLLKKTKELVSEGQSFEDVADPSRPAILVEQAKIPTIGQDEAYARVIDLIINEQVRRIGIHGMGGVGKTTLLKRINNYFKDTDFELIIWVTVSQDFTIAEIQQKIMRRCGMKDTPLDQMEGKIRDVLKGKRYVLLMDDMWESLDLNSLGVPTGDDDVNSKILITTRSEGICDRMKATKVHVDCLNPSESWKLFTAKAGEAILTSDHRIEEMAIQICHYCGGLPLALEVIGTAMSEKHTLPEWKAAKNTLEKHASRFEDTEKKLFSCLRLSYDYLKNDTMRECFCYCALFREDWEINTFDLVLCWIGEGLFDDEWDNIDAAYDKGHTIIQDLLKASLLKEVQDGKDEISAISNKMFNIRKVVMHDVLREMALLIKEDEFKISKGRSGFGKSSGKEARLGLTTFGKDESTERRKELVQFGKSPNLSTLIMTSKGLALLGDDTLEAMNKLRVLHVYEWENYGWKNREFPPTIRRLKELRYLNLINSTQESTEMLAELGSLRLLIINFPYGKFNLSFEGGFSRLSKLKALFLRRGNHHYGVEVNFGVSISELESLPSCLEDLELFIGTTSFLKELAQSPKLARCVSHLEILKLDDIRCFRLIKEVGTMDRLKFLILEGDSSLTKVVIEEEQRYTLCNLTLLLLLGLNELKQFRVSMEPRNSLQYLKIIRIVMGHRLKFAYKGWPLPGLEVLIVQECFEVKEIFKISGGSGTVFPSLRFIFARECPMLKRFCSDAFCFPSLQILEVTDCEQLKRLPRGVIQASKESLREIRGSPIWWDALTWDSKEDKMLLLPLFKSTYIIDDDSDEDNISDDTEEDNTGDDHSKEDNISDDLEEDVNGNDHSELEDI